MAFGLCAGAWADSNDTRDTAFETDLDSDWDNSFHNSGDVDWFRFDVPSRRTVRIWTTGSMDTVGCLEDGAGNLVATNDDGGAGSRANLVVSIGPSSGNCAFDPSQPPDDGLPDLVVESPSANPASLAPGRTFTLSARVCNRGGGAAAATTLRWCRSSDAGIAAGDEQVGTDDLGGLAAGAGANESIGLSAPSAAGTHYYGACADPVQGELNTGNNCSAGVRVVVSEAGGGCGGHRPDDRGWGRGRRPVIDVGWDDAQLYVRWLSGRTGRRYRLLSESEWEYAARAGTTGPFHAGGTISTDQANYDGRRSYPSGNIDSDGAHRGRTVPVGSFAPNAFGLCDVHGNVREWVQDCWNDSYQGAPSDGRAWESGDCALRVLRGRSWDSAPRVLRSANRYRVNAGSGTTTSVSVWPGCSSHASSPL